MKCDDLVGAKVVGVDSGVYVDFDKLFLELPDGKVVTVSPIYDEGLYIDEEGK